MTLTASAEETAPRSPGVSLSTAAPRRRGVWRRLLGWLFVLALLLGGTFIAGRLASSPPAQGGALDPESPGPSGALAIVEILRQQGVDVTVVRSRTEAASQLDGDTTLAMTDPAPLSDEGAQDLIDASARTVLLSSSARMLRLTDLGESSSAVPVRTAPDCDAAEFAHVGSIVPERMFTPSEGVTGCFTGAADSAAVLLGEGLAMVEGSRLFSNEHLSEDGNAALALALLGQTDRVLWYVPSVTDSDITAEAPDSLGTRTPDWLTPAILLLLLAGLTAAVWRGRRFGPLVAETLPVTVRASETMHGRARLTAKAADAAHAAEAIRGGTLHRLAKRLALGDRAAAHDVADAASDRLRIPRGTLQDLLDGPPPANDQQLVELARRLSELEDAVDAALRPDLRAPIDRSTDPDDNTRSGRTSP